MIKSATEDQISKAFIYSIDSYIARSTRRMVFNFSTQTIEERGYYYAEGISGFGAGILVYKDYRYFLLTAKHNITNHIYPEEWRTESPIWVPAHHQPNIQTEDSGDFVLGSFFMARRMWDIGAISSNEHPSIDASDVVLIEFADNIVMHAMRNLPPVFLDLNDQEGIMHKNGFFDRQVLVASGFPRNKNDYLHDEEPGSDHVHFQHNIDHVVGMYHNNEEGCLFMSYDPPVSHENLNGMSGGPVYSIYENDSGIKLAGITVSGGNNILRFIPSYMFVEAIDNYRDAPCTILDPASHLTDATTERPDKVLELACSLEDDTESCLERHRLL